MNAPVSTLTIASIINGVTVSPKADAFRIDIIDPVTELSLGTLAEADAAEVDAAVAAARAAFDTGPWPRMSVAQRQTIMRKIADGVDANAEKLLDVECAHTGLPVSVLRAMHIPRTAANFRFFAEYIGQAPGRSYHQEPGFTTWVTREPIGVAALIAPWNVPLGLGMMKVAAAIAFGCTCVLKPSEQTPFSFPLMMEIFKAAGLPDGVVNLVNGRGHITGSALTNHPQVDCVSFTGGTETGKRIGAAAGGSFKPFTMELGGKSASIVFDDADMEAAIAGCVTAAFNNNGQQCLAGSRVLVQSSIAEAFTAAFVARVKALKIGDPRAPDTQMGPLQSRAHRDRVLSFVARAEADGCTILTGGGTAKGFERGFFVDPIVATAPDNGRIICQEEIFGPFATIITFDDAADAVKIANDSPFGLVGYVWTKDLDKALAVSGALQTGVVWVNTTLMRELRAPFGGWKESGVGREGGDACAQLFTQERVVTIKRGMTL